MRQQHREHMDPPAKKNQTDTPDPAVQRFGNKPGVLVVDDEHMVRVMVQLGLERNGFQVWCASHGREAIELYRAHGEEIAVVLLDVRMPGLDGPQTLDALRELNRDVLACFMNADKCACQRDELMQRGAADVIAKPFHLEELANTLRLLTNGGQAELAPSGDVCRGSTWEERTPRRY